MVPNQTVQFDLIGLTDLQFEMPNSNFDVLFFRTNKTSFGIHVY